MARDCPTEDTRRACGDDEEPAIKIWTSDQVISDLFCDGSEGDEVITKPTNADE